MDANGHKSMSADELLVQASIAIPSVTITAPSFLDERLDDGEGLTTDVSRVLSAWDVDELATILGIDASQIVLGERDVGRGASAAGFFVEYWPEVLGALSALDILLNHYERIQQVGRWLRSKRKRTLYFPDPNTHAALSAHAIYEQLPESRSIEYCSTTRLGHPGSTGHTTDEFDVFRSVFLVDRVEYLAFFTSGDGYELGYAEGIAADAHAVTAIDGLTDFYLRQAGDRASKQRGFER